ncbi:hypothetical protein EJ04DRAFT_61016 [Polyplosphaeria fusca]|uniref:Uncharacterized protein n=1 Tax=Polyplosphaeria fusca TaxID=682080 RepID=A0A9P4R7Q5_9PLEO|nr:hypothetical protein EJ04DRAFT_61016 [Polyplosphaeria fusca]
MPPIRPSPITRPLKTERTHEENQERAYIAASRRSDRSLEARIESARRASEIHKKRTGRALRVTEQDVVNEEMYEEEDDDLPAQYQRLSAHINSSSMIFNQRLHDYLATHAGVRGTFMQHYTGNPLGSQFSPSLAQFPGQTMSPFIPQTQMLPPQVFTQPSQNYNQTSPSYNQQNFQQSYRQSPYSIPNRPQPHQRSASVSTPQPLPSFQQGAPHVNTTTENSSGEANRRMSLPPHILEYPNSQGGDASRPQLSPSASSTNVQQQKAPSDQNPSSTATTPTSTQGTPRSGQGTPTALPSGVPNYTNIAQNMNFGPLSMSLPPESQQFVGSALDPADPCTSIFMAGSDRIAQPFTGTYTYNPNISPRPKGANTDAPTSSGINSTLAPSGPFQLDMNADTMSSKRSDLTDPMVSPYSSDAPTDFIDFSDYSLFTPTGLGQTLGHDQSTEFTSFLNEDMWGDNSS